MAQAAAAVGPEEGMAPSNFEGRRWRSVGSGVDMEDPKTDLEDPKTPIKTNSERVRVTLRTPQLPPNYAPTTPQLGPNNPKTPIKTNSERVRVTLRTPQLPPNYTTTRPQQPKDTHQNHISYASGNTPADHP
jgi:hypothetical protein